MKLFDSDIKYIARTRDSQMTLEHEIDSINQKFVQEFKSLQNSSNENVNKYFSIWKQHMRIFGNH